MPASLLTEMGSGLENQRALQIALELSKLGLNDNEAAAAASISMPTSSSAYEHNEAVVKKSANMTECVPVPSSEHVAEIVGRQGCKIKALRAKTNTYIKTPVRGAEPVFVVTGRREDVAAAKREILSAADHFSQIRASRRNNNGSTPGTSPSISVVPPGPPSPTTPGQVTIQVRVPYRVVGLVVGPKGATIKRIQQQTHTYIVTPSRDKEPIFEVTGLPENVEKARQEIESHIAARTGGVLDGQLPSMNGGLPPSSSGHEDHHHHHCGDFHSSGMDSAAGLRDINDFLGSMYKSTSTNSAFTSYTSTAALNDSNNLMSQRGQDTNVFAFPSAMAGRSTKRAELTALSNGFGSQQASTAGFGITYESDEGIGGSPSFEAPALSLASSIWSDAGEGRNMSLFTPISAANNCMTGRRNSGSNSTSLSPPLAESSSRSPGCDHSSVRRLRSDPMSTAGLAAGVSVFAPLPAFSTSSSTSLSGGSVSTSPTDSTGSLASSTSFVNPGGQRRCCFVCGDGSVVAALVPCGHNLFCMDCANFLMAKPEIERRCPVCHQQPTQAIRIFST